MTDFTFDLLRRWPALEAPELVAVDATDRLLLDESAGALASAAPGTVSVIGDRFGALTLGAVALHGASEVRTHVDQLTGRRALDANADRAGLAGTFTSHGLDAALLAGAEVVLIQLPRSLAALDEIAGLVAEHAAPGVRVFAGGRIKHMTTGMNEVLSRYFTDVSAHLARQKSRVLHASGPRADRTGSAWPAVARHDDLGLTVCAHGPAFAGTSIDLGTRVLLDAQRSMAPGARTALDLGCGTGVVAASLALARPDLGVTATDDSWAAVASARATALANG
uniref:methyltransferase n=1 Tax=Actinotalea sp. TaxID=1872145 RepID=UPI00356256A1